MQDNTTRQCPSRGRPVMFGLIMLTVGSVVASVLTNFSNGLLDAVSSRWGQSAVRRLLSWQELERSQHRKTPNLAALTASADRNMEVWLVLKNVNNFFNRLPYYLDIVHWGRPEYWATPVEFLASNGGDCVDYAVAKYFTLKDAGIPASMLRMTYVRALRQNQAHMVLAYYPTPAADPLILDNLISEIKLASQRPDLEPVFSFNDDDVWTVAAGIKHSGGASHIRTWRDLHLRLAREQQM